MLVDYLYQNLKNHNFWAYRYFFCEFLGILNVVGKLEFFFAMIFPRVIPGQMFLMDRFFDGTFLTFGIEVISFAERDQEDRIDPMVRQLCFSAWDSAEPQTGSIAPPPPTPTLHPRPTTPPPTRNF